MSVKMHAPYVKILEASDEEKEQLVYELAMFVYGRWKSERKSQKYDKIETDKTDENGN